MLNNSKAAFLIIDMQKGSFIPSTPRWDTSGVCERINQISSVFRSSNLPVIHIQHDGSRDKEYIPGTEQWEIIDEIDVHVSDSNIQKYANNCFYNSSLLETLHKLEVEELWISGCATDFCVSATIQGALVNDFDINVLENCHTTGDRPGLNAKQVIDHYNFVWSNMTPTGGVIKVISFQEAINMLIKKVLN